MRTLPLSAVANWTTISRYRSPASIDLNCPWCGRAINIRFENHYLDAPRSTVSLTGKCSGCKKEIHFWLINPTLRDAKPGEESSEEPTLCVHPSTTAGHSEIEGAAFIPAEVRRPYQDAINVFNAGVWSATNTLCRTALEGMVTTLTGEKPGVRPLAQMLRDLPKSVDLGQPITSLADNLRKGGNLGAHFNPDATPDREMAKTMLEVLEYLLEYFFTIPKLIQAAQATLDRTPPQASTASSNPPE